MSLLKKILHNRDNRPEGRKLFHPIKNKNYLYDSEREIVYYQKKSTSDWKEIDNIELKEDLAYIDKYGVSKFKLYVQTNNSILEKHSNTEVKKNSKSLLTKSLDIHEDYKMSHTAPMNEGNNSADNLLEVFGEDIYSSEALKHFGHSNNKEINLESINAIKSMKDNPEKEIIIYRAIPSNLEGIDINKGDWVTTSKSYAEEHGKDNLGNDYKILTKLVKAKDLFTEGNSIHEWGWRPEPIKPKKKKEQIKHNSI